MLSSLAANVYFASAVLTAVLIGLVTGIRISLALTSRTWVDVPRSLVAAAGFVLLLGVVGAAVLWVAMLYFWYGYDQRSDNARAFSLICLFGLGPIASLVYYFTVYRPRTRSLTTGAQCATTASNP